MEKIKKSKGEIAYKKEEQLWRDFWINKLGYYPTKIEKVVRKVTWEEDRRESEELYKELKAFKKNYKKSVDVYPFFRTEIS